MARVNWLTADLVAGTILVVAGAAALDAALGYGLGSTAFIGPGALPAAVSVLVIACGLGLMVPVRGESTPAPAFRLRPAICIIGGIAAWIVITPRLGLVAGTFALILMAAMAQEQPRWLTAVLTAALMSALGGGLFVTLLGIQLPMARWP